MPKLKIVWRQPQPAVPSQRPQQRLLVAGSRRYRTTQRPDVFFWAEDPEGSTVPTPRSAGRGKKAARLPGQAPARRASTDTARRHPRTEAPSVDAPAEVFNRWLSNLYRHPRR